jgi:hypothetical protein
MKCYRIKEVVKLLKLALESFPGGRMITVVLIKQALSHNIRFGADGAGRNYNDKQYEFSVRCIKD